MSCPPPEPPEAPSADPARPPGRGEEPEIGEDRHQVLVIGMVAVFVACAVFGASRLATTLLTGFPTPWWSSLAGLAALAILYPWYRRDPEGRSGAAAHATALIATAALLASASQGLVSSIWWLSLVGFALIAVGRPGEAWIWGLAVPALMAAGALLEPRGHAPAAPGETLVESALSKTAFALVLGGMAAAFRRVSERRMAARRRAEEQARSFAERLRASEQKLLLIINNVPQLVFWKDRASVYQGCNANFAAAAGVGSPAAIVGKSDHDLPWTAEETERYRRDDREVMESGKPRIGIIETQRMASGKQAHVETNKVPLRDASGRVVGVLGTYEDVTERREAERRIEHLAYHDGLTGLPNRLLLEDRLAQAVAGARRHGRTIAVLFLDLDDFKGVNDRHGHEGGDVLLREMGRRLTGAVRLADTVARIGGDEFVVLLLDLTGRADALAAIQRVQAAIRRPLVLDGASVSLTASIGAAIFPDGERGGDDLLRNADSAMYVAKRSGRDRHVFFEPALAHDLPGRDRKWEEVAAAFANRELALVFQPTVNLRTGAVVGAEALLRWNRPGQGLRPPSEFLPAIQDTDLIVDVGAWVLEAALGQLEAWRAAGRDLSVGVNVAARQIQGAGFCDMVREALRRHPAVPPDRVELEIVESTAFDDLATVQATVARCRELGVRFCLDDFGTGYSSLSYLKRLPVDVVKIDQSFVRTMLENREDLAIVEGVLSMAAVFGRRTVAEGVTSPDHPPRLLRLGCELAQGYLFSRPMSGADFPAFLAAWRPDRDWVALAAGEAARRAAEGPAASVRPETGDVGRPR